MLLSYISVACLSASKVEWNWSETLHKVIKEVVSGSKALCRLARNLCVICMCIYTVVTANMRLTTSVRAVGLLLCTVCATMNMCVSAFVSRGMCLHVWERVRDFCSLPFIWASCDARPLVWLYMCTCMCVVSWVHVWFCDSAHARMCAKTICRLDGSYCVSKVLGLGLVKWPERRQQNKRERVIKNNEDRRQST